MTKTDYIILGALIFSGFASTGVYFIQTGVPPVSLELPQTSTSTPQVGEEPAPPKELTREDILNSNWPYTYMTFEGYRIYEWGDKVIVRDDASNKILYEKALDSEEIFRRNITAVGYDNQTKRIYLLTGATHDGLWWVFEGPLVGGPLKEIAHGESEGSRTLRFSPDRSTLSFLSDTPAYTAVSGFVKARYYFNIVTLTDPAETITFEIPGDAEKYVSEHSFTPQEAIKVRNIVGAYRLVGDMVEFTRYYAIGTEHEGYSQISDKELWSYDRATGALELLETVPVGRESRE